MKMYTYLLLVVSTSAFAYDTKTYMANQAEIMSHVLSIKQRIEKQDRTLCPNEKHESMSYCLKSYMKGHSITSSAELTGLLMLPLSAGLIDRDKKGFSGMTSTLMMLDSVMNILESTDPKVFSVAVRSADPELISLENELLSEAKKKIVRTVSQKLKSLQPYASGVRDLAAEGGVKNWDKAMKKSLNSRFKAFKKRDWQISSY
ncbi:MAG: hypothetical protein HRT45_10565 [Bdellovibrionales bacterium]|nr:hypothetical protein [Bdellovibrionales bacterium]